MNAALTTFFAVVLLGAGCDDGGARRAPEPTPPPEASALAALQALASATASAAPTAKASAEAPSGEAGALGGSWDGKYEAKKAALGMPPKVKDKARASDDGKIAVGAGTLALTVSPAGDVRGRCKGALGEGALVGRVDGPWVRATLMPDDPTAAAAMTGVLVAKLADGKLDGELRAAGPDALLVREATFSLAKK